MPITISPDANTPSIVVNSQPLYLPTATGNVALTSSLGIRNRIINGKMDISQRGASFAAITAAYCLDRWRVAQNTTAVVTATQQADTPSNDFQNSLRVTVTTAKASPLAAGDLCAILQAIEGANVRDLVGKTFTLSFWVRSPKIGVHCVSMRNTGPDRTYIAEYTVNSANTWEYKTITVVGGLPTTGTWNFGTGMGIDLGFTFACGSTYQTTAGAWQTGSFFATTNQVNCLDTVGNIFAITGVQLETGGNATIYEHRPYGVEMFLCQRYYEVVNYPSFYLPTTAATIMYLPFMFRTEKRVAPTVTLPSATNAAWTAAGSNTTPTSWSIQVATTSGFSIFVGSSGAIGGIPSNAVTATAEL